MAGNIASINIKFLADLSQFSTKMQNANRSIAKVGKQMQQVGAGLTLGVTAPLLALGTAGVKAWDKQQKAIAQVETGLKSTGNAAGFTSGELQKLASELQDNSLFGDEDILTGVTSQLLTFTNIANEQFERTQLAALDLSTRLGVDLKSSAIQLGKALNDPVANLSALSRSGIQFSTDQKEVINQLVKTNQLAKAQTIILDELEKQYGGSAAAAAAAGLGGLKQLSNILGDLSEDFGGIIAEALLPFVEKLKTIAVGFREMSPEAKKAIVIIAGIAAVIPPLLALAGTILPLITTGFGLLLSPVGLVVGALTAIGVIIYKNWQPIKKVLVDIANYFIDLYNESTVFRFGVEAIVLAFKNVWSVGKFVFAALGTIIKSLAKSIKDSFVNIGAIIKAALTFDLDAMKEALSKVKDDAANNFSSLIEGLNEDFKGLSNNIGDNIQSAIENVAQRTKIELIPENINTDALENKVADSITKGASGRKKATAVEGATAGAVEVPLTNPLAGLADTTIQEVQAVNDEVDKLFVNAGGIMEGAAESFVGGFAEIAGAIAAGNASMGDVFGLLLNLLGDVAIQIGKAAISIGIAMKAVKLSFSNPFAAIAAGAALVLIGSLMKGLASNFGGGGVPALASGGLAFAPTLAVVGDNVGAASDPEVIAPLSKLKDYIQPSGFAGTIKIELAGKVNGRDIDLIGKRVVKELNRVK